VLGATEAREEVAARFELVDEEVRVSVMVLHVDLVDIDVFVLVHQGHELVLVVPEIGMGLQSFGLSEVWLLDAKEATIKACVVEINLDVALLLVLFFPRVKDVERLAVLVDEHPHVAVHVSNYLLVRVDAKFGVVVFLAELDADDVLGPVVERDFLEVWLRCIEFHYETVLTAAVKVLVFADLHCI